MAITKENLDSKCDEAIYEISCIRPGYQKHVMDYFEKCIDLQIKIDTMPMQSEPIPLFKKTILTNEENLLFESFRKTVDNNGTKHQKGNIRALYDRISELQSILNQINKNSHLYEIIKKLK